MKIKSIILVTGLFVIVSILISGYTGSKTDLPPGRDRLFNTGWKFVRDSIPGAEIPAFDDSEWMSVDLPHDYSIMDLPGDDSPAQVGPFSRKSPGNGNSTGHVIGGTGWYRKSFTLDKADQGKTVVLNFDGVYMETAVWVNGKKAGIHKNGYTPFWFDISSLLNAAGKPNVIAVKVDNPGRNSRWYSGSGIYRNVHLTITQPVHIAVWGVKIITPVINKTSATVDIAVTAENVSPKDFKAQITINLKDKNGKIAGTAIGDVVLSARSETILKKQVEVKNPILWSLESPDLYEAEILIVTDKKVTDKFTQSFGIRSIEITAEKGFLLNGKSVELKGGCLHHDNGFLGSAAFDRAEVRRVELMKANGYNAIRCSHNPPSETFLNACDRLGILVIDEFTDMWEAYKNPQDYSQYFREWWNRDLTDMIMRDRNHPSVILWSIGNEIPESSDTAGVRIGNQLATRVRALDNTRHITEAISEILTPGGWKSTPAAFKILDVGGYNYTWNKYESDHKQYPERIMVGTESFPLDAYETWMPVEKSSYVIGDFVWTAMDYIGEVSLGNSSIAPGTKTKIMKMPEGFQLPKGINIFDLTAKQPTTWPYFVSGCGDIDMLGDKKPQMLYRDVLWDISKLEINVHAPVPAGFAETISMWGWPDEWPSWTWKGSEGKPLQVRVFTKAPHVKLELNGKTVAEKDLKVEDKYIAVFDVPYQKGELRATASENGKVIAEKVLKTSGEPVAVRLVADRSKLKSDRSDLAYVKIEIIDSGSLIVPIDSVSLKITVSGNGELVGSGNANPKDMASVNRPLLNTFKGKAIAIIRPKGSGTIKLIAESAGLKTGEMILTAEN